jgi:hypothetical protein
VSVSDARKSYCGDSDAPEHAPAAGVSTETVCATEAVLDEELAGFGLGSGETVNGGRTNDCVKVPA